MAKITVWRSNLKAAKERCILNEDESAIIDDILSVEETSHISFDANRLPVAYARALLEDGKLKPNQRAVLALRVHGMRGDSPELDSMYSKMVGSPVEFGTVILALNRYAFNIELMWNGRWYPIRLLVDMKEDEDKLVKFVTLHTALGIGSTTCTLGWDIDPAIFLDHDSNRKELSVLNVLESMGFRAVQTKPSDYNLRLVRAQRLSAESGKQVWVKGTVLDLRQKLWRRSSINDLPLGTEDMPRRGVIEPELETEDQGYNPRFGHNTNSFDESVSRVPFVRVFSMDIKDYVFADIDDLADYDYDETALERLYLPEEMKNVLQRVFETPTSELFGDLIRGKHGGVVVLACGSPGVGKTLTAEVYAEITERPLYTLEFGEMGTTVEQIESNLEQIFARIVRWSAVLQFDECEIFLAQRGGDLERSAIVGIFLRMLDYYEGLLFLTTNRPEVLDEAILSRVMLRLDYPDLDRAGRSQIWKSMFSMAGLTLAKDGFEQLAEVEVNGRQIRNYTRLIRIVHPQGNVTIEQIKQLLRYGSTSDVLVD